MPRRRAREAVLLRGDRPALAGRALLQILIFHREKESGLTVVWPLTSLVICASVFCHGVTAAPFSRMLARHRSGAPAHRRNVLKQADRRK